MKKTLSILVVISIFTFFLFVNFYCLAGQTFEDKLIDRIAELFVEKQSKLQISEEGQIIGGVSGSPILRKVNLVGTGHVYTVLPDYASTTGIGIATTTTMYQFASSSNRTYWDTIYNPFPNKYGATTTAYLLTEQASGWTLYGEMNATNTDSLLKLEFAVSNDAGCNEASSTLNMALWYPMPDKATSTPDHYALTNENFNMASTTKTIKPGSTQKKTFAYKFDEINYRCARITAYNSSTTDDSTIYFYAILNE